MCDNLSDDDSLACEVERCEFCGKKEGECECNRDWEASL